MTVALALLVAPSSAGAANLSSTFDTDAEGWVVFGNNNASPNTPTAPTYNGTGGNPGGYVSDTDVRDDMSGSGVWFLQSPATWAGNRTANYGGTLSFDAQASGTPNQPAQVQIFDSSGNALAFQFSSSPMPAFTPFSVTVRETTPGWTYHPPGGMGTPATAQNFFDVLGSMQVVFLLGDLSIGTTGETTDFDNISFLEPATAPDSDGDGVPDISDNCINQAGPASNSGCPLPAATPPAATPPAATPPSTPTTPSNQFSAAGSKSNKKKGTAQLTFNLPGPGQLEAEQAGAGGASAAAKRKRKRPRLIKPASLTAPAAGPATITIRPTKAGKAILKRKGKLKTKAQVTFTPTGGSPRSQVVPVLLKLK